MITLIYIVCYFIWIGYFLIEGYREAYYYNSLSLQFYIQDKQKKDLHTVFTLQRCIIALLINIICITLTWKLILLNLALLCIQPFIHNGMYYYTRNKLNYKLYPKKWFDMSSTSTAKSTKYETPTVRIIAGIISVLIIILLIFI